MTQTYNNRYAHSHRVNGHTLAEQMAEQMIWMRGRYGSDRMMVATIACAKAWDVYYSPFKVAA